MYLHGLVYEYGYLTFGKPEHYVANIALDYFLLASVVFFMLVTVGLTYPFLQKAEKTEGKKAKSL
jgi:hypothetical protein